MVYELIIIKNKISVNNFLIFKKRDTPVGIKNKWRSLNFKERVRLKSVPITIKCCVTNALDFNSERMPVIGDKMLSSILLDEDDVSHNFI